MFNSALSAKQGWRLFTQPNCLFVRVMKIKYYPRDNFLNARLEAYPLLPGIAFGILELTGKGTSRGNPVYSIGKHDSIGCYDMA
ncbi:Ribonuclease H-like superfamily protein [Gossypium australe]|uniref:Ribonuclease H-like superfamily protein n=1 Tax=Gossypium australe TaxID=47621 RepID=A0A5B6WTJ9_9ROSI|nr:Ribonuclease H-like superfamily protein [Gossypium australe]